MLQSPRLSRFSPDEYLTQEMMRNYQNNELPEINELDKLNQKYEELISRSKDFVKQAM